MLVFKKEFEQITKNTPVNVLDLGFDNTGTKDNTELFEKYTALFPLYFPSGEYLFNDTIHPKHSIYGVYSFQGNTAFSNNFTRLKSKASKTSFAIDIIDVVDTNMIDISGFVVDCLNTCGGIGYHTDSYSVVTIDRVTISSLGTIGFDIAPNTMQSRCAVLSHCMVYSSPTEKETIGYHFSFNAPDCTMSYCYTSMPRIGIKSEANILTLSDVHLWGGWTTKVTNTHWVKTKGLYLEGCTIEATNLYVDTFYLLFYAVGTRLSTVNVCNLTVWFDDSISEVTTTDGSFMYGKFDTINVYNGYGYFANVMPNVFSYKNLSMNNFTVVSDKLFTVNNLGELPLINNARDNYNLTLTPSGAQACEIASIAFPQNCGSFEIELFDNYGNQTHVQGFIKSGVLYCYKTSKNGGLNLLYSFSDKLFTLYGDYNNTCNIKVYIQTALQAYAFNYKVMKTDRTPYVRQYVTDKSTLTVVTETVVTVPEHTHDSETGAVVNG